MSHLRNAESIIDTEKDEDTNHVLVDENKLLELRMVALEENGNCWSRLVFEPFRDPIDLLTGGDLCYSSPVDALNGAAELGLCKIIDEARSYEEVFLKRKSALSLVFPERGLSCPDICSIERSTLPGTTIDTDEYFVQSNLAERSSPVTKRGTPLHRSPFSLLEVEALSPKRNESNTSTPKKQIRSSSKTKYPDIESKHAEWLQFKAASSGVTTEDGLILFTPTRQTKIDRMYRCPVHGCHAILRSTKAMAGHMRLGQHKGQS